jgi:starvation-inducible DNA-binding protein
MSVSTKEPIFKTSIDLDSDVRSDIIRLVNQQLADLTDLYSQTKQAHWNVKGENFYSLHLLFDSLAAAISPQIDDVAERVTALGGVAQGTVRMAASHSRLPEYPEAVDGRAHLKALAARFAECARSTRAAIHTAQELGDDGTADLFTQISRDLDKHLWFIEAHMQG